MTQRRKVPNTAAPAPDGSTTTYVLEMKDGGMKKVTVPSSWHTTFGPIAPTLKPDGATGGYSGISLRFYNGEKQMACFTNVVGFRDASIEIVDRVVLRDEQVMQREDVFGGQAFVAKAERYEWRNPDDLRPPESPKKMLEGAKRAAGEVFGDTILKVD